MKRLFLVSTLISGAVWPLFGQTAAPSRTVWNGVFTAAQAARGKGLWEAHCVNCHNSDLDPQNIYARFRGAPFMERWREYDVGSLFDLIKTTMPRRNPASLPDNVYVDIVSHILNENSFPVGRAELTLVATKAIQIEGKDGPKPIPNGSLAQVVGCLVPGAQDRWTLRSAGEPARTMRSVGSTSAELEAAQHKPLGSYVFQLQNIDYVRRRTDLDTVAGKKVQIKGYLVRQPNRERIDVNSVEALGSECTP